MTTSPKSGHSSVNFAPTTLNLREYTLQRDGDRALQFIGSEVAAIDSGDRQITYRAAIYRTRGGKYVSEFSSRPAPVPSPYRDPPERMPSADEVAEHKEVIVSAIIDTAEWREGKAQQFPNDLRNAQSADALRELATALEEIPATDSRWMCLWLAEYGLDADLVEDTLSIAQAQLTAKSELIRGYGFHLTDLVSPPTPLEARRFLDGLLQALQAAAQPEPAARATGKAQAFETLDEAIGWFRPGRLTTELLRLLGRMDPEIID